jgi:hypothetical protein
MLVDPAGPVAQGSILYCEHIDAFIARYNDTAEPFV